MSLNGECCIHVIIMKSSPGILMECILANDNNKGNQCNLLYHNKSRIICSTEKCDSFMNVGSLYSNHGYVECACSTLAKLYSRFSTILCIAFDASPLSARWQQMP